MLRDEGDGGGGEWGSVRARRMKETGWARNGEKRRKVSRGREREVCRELARRGGQRAIAPNLICIREASFPPAQF
jgi:hypothetical protein